MNANVAQAPVSRRRRAAAPPKRTFAGLPMPRIVAAAVALAGALLVLCGALQATVFAPSEISRADLAGTRQPVVSTAVGLLGLDGPRLQVDVRDARRPVFIGIGRAADVDAYLGQVARVELTGHDGEGALTTRRLGSEPALPDPAGADVWLTSERGQGTASIAWPDTPGQWRLVIATDGTERAPESVQLTWSGREVHTSAPALISVGLVFAVAGLITLVMLSSRAGLATGTGTGTGSRAGTGAAANAGTGTGLSAGPAAVPGNGTVPGSGTGTVPGDSTVPGDGTVAGGGPGAARGPGAALSRRDARSGAR